MPLIHLLLSVACVAAAALMVVLAHDHTTRAAHAVMAAAMVVMLLAPTAVGVAAGALGLVAVVLAHRERGRCAVDAAGCALLMTLAVVAAWLRPDTGHAMAGMPGMHAPPDGHDVVLRLVGAVVVVVAWHLLRRRTSPTGQRGSTPAAWVMVLAMGAMAVTS